jgi:hypothetical protein
MVMKPAVLAKWALGIVVFCGLGVLYYVYDPSVAPFPRCPLLVLTGIKCPGCGSQRAVHHLLHLDVASAMRDNFLLVLSIPYLVAGFALQWTRQQPDLLRRWYGYQAARVVFVVVMGFWVVRNLLGV